MTQGRTGASSIAIFQQPAKPLTADFKIGGIAYAGTDITPYQRWEKAGYMKVNGPMFGRSYYTFTVALTEAGEDAVKKYGWKLGPKDSSCMFAASCPPPEPRTLTIPIALCRVLEVTGIVEEGKKATADVVFGFEANDFMKAMGKRIGDPMEIEKQSGKREFTLYDDGWRVDPVVNQ